MLKKIKIVLSKKQLLYFYFFIFLSFLSMIFETLGIGLIIPFMQTLVTEGINQRIAGFLNLFGIYPASKYDLIFILILAIAIVYTFKAVFLTYFSYAENKLLADLRVSLKDKLYSAYLNKPYSFHLNNNSSTLMRNINEVDLVVFVLKSLILLINETIVFLGIFAFIIFYEPKGSLLIILFFSSFGYIFFKKIQDKLSEWGKTRQITSGLSLKYLQEGFGSIKDIKILQRSDYLVNAFTKNNKNLNLSERKEQFIDSLPKLWLEWLVVIAFVLLIFFMLFQEKEFIQIVPLLGLFAAAAYRVTPSLARILNAVQGIIYNRPAVDSVYKEYSKQNFKENVDKTSSKKIFLNKEVNLQNINFKYSNSSPLILRDINLNIKSGTTIGLIGESGIGKTTLINIILGLIQPTSGSIQVDGVDIVENINSWQSRIGYVPQNIYLADDTIKRNIAFALPDEKIDDVLVKKAITNAKLDSLIDNLNEGVNTSVGEFGDKISGGQRQRIAIARALYKDPQILILDECTNSLDIKTEKQIMNEVNSLKGKKTIIMVTHRLSTLENCDRIYKIDREGFKLEKS